MKQHKTVDTEPMISSCTNDADFNLSAVQVVISALFPVTRRQAPTLPPVSGSLILQSKGFPHGNVMPVSSRAIPRLMRQGRLQTHLRHFFLFN